MYNTIRVGHGGLLGSLPYTNHERLAYPKSHENGALKLASTIRDTNRINLPSCFPLEGALKLGSACRPSIMEISSFASTYLTPGPLFVRGKEKEKQITNT